MAGDGFPDFESSPNLTLESKNVSLHVSMEQVSIVALSDQAPAMGPCVRGHIQRDNQFLKEYDTSVTQDPVVWAASVLPTPLTPLQAPGRHFTLLSHDSHTEQICMLTPGGALPWSPGRIWTVEAQEKRRERGMYQLVKSFLFP